MILGELHHALHREVLILRDMNILHGIIVEVCFLPPENIFQEVDSHVVCIRRDKKLKNGDDVP